MQRARRTNPYPWTWEPPVAAAGTFALLAVLAMHAARALAALFAGHGWQMTQRAQIFSSVPGLLAGDASTGLAVQTNYASTTQLWAWTAATEGVVCVVALMALRWWLVRWGPGRVHGMASAAEVEHLLGPSRLRRNAPVIRPDLYGAKAAS
jgi:hypothetical protein